MTTRRAFTFWEIMAGVPAMRAEWDRQDRLERIAALRERRDRR